MEHSEGMGEMIPQVLSSSGPWAGHGAGSPGHRIQAFSLVHKVKTFVLPVFSLWNVLSQIGQAPL